LVNQSPWLASDYSPNGKLTSQKNLAVEEATASWKDCMN
jgi:hypothetical protein